VTEEKFWGDQNTDERCFDSFVVASALPFCPIVDFEISAKCISVNRSAECAVREDTNRTCCCLIRCHNSTRLLDHGLCGCRFSLQRARHFDPIDPWGTHEGRASKLVSVLCWDVFVLLIPCDLVGSFGDKGGNLFLDHASGLNNKRIANV